MPTPRVINTTRDKPEPTGVQEFFSKLQTYYKDKEDQSTIGRILKEYGENAQDADALRKAYIDLETSNIGPTKRLEAIQGLGNMENVIANRDKVLNAKARSHLMTMEERATRKQNLLQSGMPEWEADVYLDAPASVQASIEKSHRDLLNRGIRQPLTEQRAFEKEVAQGNVPLAQANQMIGIEGEKAPFPDIESPKGMTPAERVKWENANQKENNVQLKESQDKKKALRGNDILIKSMSKINDSNKLPTNLGRIIIDPKTGDLRETAQLTGLANKETQLYVKNLKQFLKGAKEYFGARVTNFDVSAFMQQLPTLLNTEDGRRLILKQMDLVNQLETVYNDEINDAYKHYGRKANFSDITRIVDDRVSAKEEVLLDRINNVVEASDYMDRMIKNPEKFKGSVLMEKEGRFKAVPENKIDIAESKGWSKY